MKFSYETKNQEHPGSTLPFWRQLYHSDGSLYQIQGPGFHEKAGKGNTTLSAFIYLYIQEQKNPPALRGCSFRSPIRKNQNASPNKDYAFNTLTQLEMDLVKFMSKVQNLKAAMATGGNLKLQNSEPQRFRRVHPHRWSTVLRISRTYAFGKRPQIRAGHLFPSRNCDATFERCSLNPLLFPETSTSRMWKNWKELRRLLCAFCTLSGCFQANGTIFVQVTTS
ncbi:uncharacterized protein [Physeter macrocephalus]|uniref:Uncharacterized protein n=1 Tax=Physeter macrocephalus TaxID=9755 RepID=A0A455C1L8_PHYMC|nr:uncharacterized protein LOC114483946 [Physeter catodon]|eukprot:XP_028354877.1 uncharacterized protein LOC114483946 [Physeter catodon]